MGAGAGEPIIQKKEKLVGYKNFKRQNPLSDRFEVKKFHHVEFCCGDANMTYRRFAAGLGMQLVAKSDNSTGNSLYASYVLKSKDLTFVMSAPYGSLEGNNESMPTSSLPNPGFNSESYHQFFKKHGMGVTAVGLLVGDAKEAYHQAVTRGGARGILEPTLRKDENGTEMMLSEIALYGDVVLRLISGNFEGEFMPGYVSVESEPLCYGLERLDHCVGNVPNMLETYNYLVSATGFHEFAEFTAEDVGTVDSGLNSIVASSNNELVLFPINEPTFGTKRKSQIQTYLEQNNGGGVQHLALKTDDIFNTLRHMRKQSSLVGFELMPRPSAGYYKELVSKIGNALTVDQYKLVEELGILVDKDDQGVLLQVFTKPVGDRPTLFLEIIQRVGCLREVRDKAEEVRLVQAGGCGGFGKGNFKELFKSVEEYESTLDV